MRFRASKQLGQLSICGILFGLILLTGCGRVGAPATQRRKVSIGIQVSPAMTLLMVAKDQGLFEKQGLDVDLKQFTAGKFALQAFLGGSVDFAVSGDVPVCLALLGGNAMSVVTQVVEKTTNEVRIVAAAAQGGPIKDPESFFSQRRRLATSFGGGPEFFTYQFLQSHHIRKDDVQLISMRPEDMPAALATGSLDAVSIFDPFAFIAAQRAGPKAVTFRDPNVYSELYVLTANAQQVRDQGDTISALLRALVDAEQAVANNPAQAKQILERYTKLDPAVVEGIWENFTFKPALTHQLLDYWKAEATWAKETKKVSPETKTPDFRSVVQERFLKGISADSVQF